MSDTHTHEKNDYDRQHFYEVLARITARHIATKQNESEQENRSALNDGENGHE